MHPFIHSRRKRLVESRLSRLCLVDVVWRFFLSQRTPSMCYTPLRFCPCIIQTFSCAVRSIIDSTRTSARSQNSIVQSHPLTCVV